MRFEDEYRKESEAETLQEEFIMKLADKMAETAEQKAASEKKAPAFVTEAMIREEPRSWRRIAVRAGALVAVAAAVAIALPFVLPRPDSSSGVATQPSDLLVGDFSAVDGSSDTMAIDDSPALSDSSASPSMASSSVAESSADSVADPSGLSSTYLSGSDLLKLSSVLPEESTQKLQSRLNEITEFMVPIPTTSDFTDNCFDFSMITKNDTEVLKFLVQQAPRYIAFENERIVASGQETFFEGGTLEWLEKSLQEICPGISLPKDADYAAIAAQCAYVGYEDGIFREVGDDLGISSYYYIVENGWKVQPEENWEEATYYAAVQRVVLGTDGKVYDTLDGTTIGTYEYKEGSTEPDIAIFKHESTRQIIVLEGDTEKCDWAYLKCCYPNDAPLVGTSAAE